MIIIYPMITCVFIRNMLALIIMIVSMTTCAEATTGKCTYPPDHLTYPPESLAERQREREKNLVLF